MQLLLSIYHSDVSIYAYFPPPLLTVKVFSLFFSTSDIGATCYLCLMVIAPLRVHVCIVMCVMFSTL